MDFDPITVGEINSIVNFPSRSVSCMNKTFYTFSLPFLTAALLFDHFACTQSMPKFTPKNQENINLSSQRRHSLQVKQKVQLEWTLDTFRYRDRKTETFPIIRKLFFIQQRLSHSFSYFSLKVSIPVCYIMVKYTEKYRIYL